MSTSFSHTKVMAENEFSPFTKTCFCAACTLTPCGSLCETCPFSIGLPVRLAHEYELSHPESNLTSIVIERMLEKATEEQVDLWFQYQNFVYPIPGNELPWKKCDACDHPTRGELCASCWLDNCDEVDPV